MWTFPFSGLELGKSRRPMRLAEHRMQAARFGGAHPGGNHRMDCYNCVSCNKADRAGAEFNDAQPDCGRSVCLDDGRLCRKLHEPHFERFESGPCTQLKAIGPPSRAFLSGYLSRDFEYAIIYLASNQRRYSSKQRSSADRCSCESCPIIPDSRPFRT